MVAAAPGRRMEGWGEARIQIVAREISVINSRDHSPSTAALRVLLTDSLLLSVAEARTNAPPPPPPDVSIYRAALQAEAATLMPL